MILSIGLMIVTYIIVRMIELSGDKTKSEATKSLALLNLIVTIFWMVMIVINSKSVPQY
jgi:uncharacterized membrane protein SirB2